jgi:MFS family permease
VQGYYIGKWSRKFGDRRLIFAGLALLALGVALTALTPSVPPPGYSQAALEAELTSSDVRSNTENPTTQNIPVELPDDQNTGWIGVIWLLAATIPVAIGGGMLQPTINSLITKRIEIVEIGGMLGISAALLSGANAIAPLLWGAIFQTLGPSWPFLLGAGVLVILLFIAMRMIQPGREEQAAKGLARGEAGD